MNDFESELQERLATRARQAAPVADVDVLEARIAASAVHRRRMAYAGGGSVAVLALVAVVGATAFAAPAHHELRVASEAPTTVSVPATLPDPVVVAPDVTDSSGAWRLSTDPGLPPTTTTTTSPAPVVNPPIVLPRTLDELAVQQLFVTLFDPNATDAQRLATIDDPVGLEPVMQQIRAHPHFGDLAQTTVQLDYLTYTGSESAIAAIAVTGPNRAPVTMYAQVSKVDGHWKLQRTSFCSGLVEITNLVGGGTLSCDMIDVPPSMLPTTTTVPPKPAPPAPTTTVSTTTTTVP